MKACEEIKIDDDSVMEDYFSDDIFKDFIAKIRKYPVLSGEENKRLALLAQEGDEKAREKLTNSNLRLVVHVAKCYKDKICHMSFLDIFQEGTLGLMKSINKFEPEKGSFSTCAFYWIRQAINLAIQSKEEEIRKPSTYHEKRREYLKIIEKCKKGNLPIPSDEELCKNLEITLEFLKEIKNKIETVSSNQTLDDEDTFELQDTFEDFDMEFETVETANDNQLLFVVLKNKILSPVQYYIIYHRYYTSTKKILQEINDELNVSHQRVKQIEDASLAKIEPYMLPNSRIFAKVATEFRNSGMYNIKPIEPEKIALYLYIKNELNLLEELILYYSWFGIMKIEYYLKKLDVSKEQYMKIIKLLNIKITAIKEDADFEIYKKSLIEVNGSKIFELVQPDDPNKNFEMVRKLIQE